VFFLFKKYVNHSKGKEDQYKTMYTIELL
jgi:hypothetical protein